jgi:2-polyprenyl-6-methoxyphenol hydroxylase-like FAD-dependent oxidoreductase
MTQVERTQLLIAGGGPVGLLSALCAAKHGLDVIVVERSFRGSRRGHTTLLHPRSIRVLAELGLSPLLLRAGQLIDEVKLRVKSGTQRLKLPFPALAITQSLFEETLLKVLRKEEFDLRATCEVTALNSMPGRVEVQVVRRERLDAGCCPGEEHWGSAESGSIHADFVIGADGRASHVREALGIRSTRSATERYAMFEFPSNPPPEPELVISDELGHLIIPLNEQRARASFQLPRGQEWTADLQLLAKLLAERAPQHDVPSELHWSDIVDFEPHVAEQFGRGRVWLAGDAAHTASPLGVQSMNRGISEAWELTGEIAAVIAGKRPLAALELLGNAQRKDWLQTLAVGADFESSLEAPGWLSGHAKKIVSALPASGPDLEDLLRQVGIERHL